MFHGGSGSALEEIRAAVSYGVVKMNVDTDTQYAFTREIAGHMFTNYDGVLKVDGEVGNKKAYDPRSYLKLAEVGMAARVTQACEALQSAGHRGCASHERIRQPAGPAHQAARRPGGRRSSSAAHDPIDGRAPRTRRPRRPGPPWPRRALAAGPHRSRPTPTPAPGTTVGWTPCAAPGGRAAARSRGRTSRTAGSCARCTRSPGRRAIGEDDEAARCAQFLADSDPEAVIALRP